MIHLSGLEDWENFFLMSQKAFLVANVERLAVGTRLLTAIHEHIFGTRMAMDVDKKMNVATLERLSHHLLHADDLGGRLLNRVHPLPIQI